MSYYLIILLVFLILIVFQLTLKVKISYNIISNSGKIQLRFIGIRIFDREMTIYKNYLKLSNAKHKSIYLPIEFSQESIKSYVNFQGVLFQKIYAKEFYFYLNFGIKNNPIISSLVCGHTDIIFKILYSVLSQKKKGLSYKSKIYTSFEKSVIKFQIKAKISLSLYDLMWSYLEAVIGGKLKEIKEKN